MIINTVSNDYPKGYLRNCFMMSCKNSTAYVCGSPVPVSEAMFVQRWDGVIVPQLDSYAIVPLEEYNELTRLKKVIDGWK